MPREPKGQGADTVRSAMLGVGAARGRVRELRRAFDASRVPMVLVDNERRYQAANAAARLLFRLREAELQARRIEDFSPPHMLAELDEAWARLMQEGVVAGDYDLGFPGGTALAMVYCALANILPGQHLIVFLPADWSADELGVARQPDEDRQSSGRVSPREREVLALIASGADLQQIADELTLSVTTVRTHARNALRKLGARNRAHAIALAIQHGVIDPEEPG